MSCQVTISIKHLSCGKTDTLIDEVDIKDHSEYHEIWGKLTKAVDDIIKKG